MEYISYTDVCKLIKCGWDTFSYQFYLSQQRGVVLKRTLFAVNVKKCHNDGVHSQNSTAQNIP